jgi:hypothetical protein
MIFGAELDGIRLTGGIVYSYHGTVQKEQKDSYVSFEPMHGGEVIRVLEISENYSIACIPSEQYANYVAFPVQDKPNENIVRCHYFTRATKNDNSSGYGLNLYDEAGELTFSSNALNLNVLGQLKFSQPFERELDIADDEVLGIIDLSGSPRKEIVIVTGLEYTPPDTVIGLVDIDIWAVSIHRKGNRLVGVYNRKRDRSSPRLEDVSSLISYHDNHGKASFTGFENYNAYGLLCKFRRPSQFVTAPTI